MLVRSNPRPGGFAHAATLAMEAGAAGVITDYLLYETEPFRTRESLPDAVQLLRMPSQQHNSAWSLAVDYHAGEKLAAVAASDDPRVYVDIRCRNFKGEAQNLLADISGTDKADEYVMFVCHATAGTRPGANCASGPAMLAAMARVMSGLISSGRVPRPRRTIRFLVNVEGHGSKHYIHNHREEIDNTIACIALDSVAHDQQKCKSALLYYHSPDSLPHLHQRLLRRRDERHAPGDPMGVPHCRHRALRQLPGPPHTHPGATTSTTPCSGCLRPC